AVSGWRQDRGAQGRLRRAGWVGIADRSCRPSDVRRSPRNAQQPFSRSRRMAEAGVSGDTHRGLRGPAQRPAAISRRLYHCGRLGDRWPSAPEGWTDDQEREAQRYFTETEVVVWTPGLNRGRAVYFHPLPDFAPVLDDEDDFARLLTSTVAVLAPQAGVRGDS